MDHYIYSLPSEPSFKINKLVQTLPSSHLYNGNAHNVETPCKHRGVIATSDSNKLVSDNHLGSVVENRIQTDLQDDYWCAHLIVIKCDKCNAGFKSKNDLKQHICSVGVQAKMAVRSEKLL